MRTEFLRAGVDVLKDRPDFELVGRDEELSGIMKVLMRRHAHNVLLVGAGGVGCSALCYGLQKAKDQSSTPFDIIHKRIWWLDVDGLFSKPEQTQEAWDSMMNILSNTPDNDTIVVIEDTRDFIEAINSSGNASFINEMMRELESGSFQAIFEVRDTDLDMALNCHSNMREIFTMMEIKEPSLDALDSIIETAAIKLQKHHGIDITKDAYKQAIYLTTTYPAKERSLARAQPEATLTLLDRALATYRNNSHTQPPALVLAREAHEKNPSEETLKNFNQASSDWDTLHASMAKACRIQSNAELSLSVLESDISEIRSKTNEGNSGMTMVSPEEQEVAIKIDQIKQVISDQQRTFESLSENVNSGLQLTDDDVFKEFSSLSGIPFDKLNEDESQKLLNLSEAIKKRVFGQDHVIDQLCDALLTARTPGLKERGKPDAAFMFCGSSGVGKTEIAKVLAGELKDDEGALLRFDMSEYKEKFAVSTLIGAPPGYAGYEQGGALTNAVRKNPNSIILFDEIEKADPSIFDIFLQVLDDGRLTDTQGRVVSFEHTILLFTTNTGAEHFLDSNLTFEQQFQGTLESLSNEYRAEFLNRFGGRENIVGFKVLPQFVIEMIARSQLNKVNKGFEEVGVDLKLTMSEEDIKRLCKFQYKPERGARGIDGVFRSNIYPQLARHIKTNGANGEVCTIGFEDGEFSLNVE